MAARFEPNIGRYVYLNVLGTEYRVYYEEVGKGFPLVCQHTAGTHGGFWLNIMSDPDVTSRCRVIAIDLPFHGKSIPPKGKEWWKDDWRLTKEFFLKFHSAFKDALELDKPAFIGCSMGHNLAIDLAVERPDIYRAVIGMCGSGRGTAKTWSPPDPMAWSFTYSPRFDCQVHGVSSQGMQMYDLCHPGPRVNNPNFEWDKRYICFLYGQGYYGVFQGDLYYYSYFTRADGSAKNIDTSKCMVYMVDSDWNVGTDTKVLAEEIKGSKLIWSNEIDHFAAASSWPALKPLLIPVLDEIAGLRK